MQEEWNGDEMTNKGDVEIFTTLSWGEKAGYGVFCIFLSIFFPFPFLSHHWFTSSIFDAGQEQEETGRYNKKDDHKDDNHK